MSAGAAVAALIHVVVGVGIISVNSLANPRVNLAELGPMCFAEHVIVSDFAPHYERLSLGNLDVFHLVVVAIPVNKGADRSILFWSKRAAGRPIALWKSKSLRDGHRHNSSHSRESEVPSGRVARVDDRHFSFKLEPFISLLEDGGPDGGRNIGAQFSSRSFYLSEVKPTQETGNYGEEYSGDGNLQSIKRGDGNSATAHEEPWTVQDDAGVGFIIALILLGGGSALAGYAIMKGL